MARLPIVGHDVDNWGDVLNQFLQAAHNTNGTLKGLALDVRDYGNGVGQGTSAVDTAALQAACNAGIAQTTDGLATVNLIPPLVIDTQINLAPSSGDRFRLNLQGPGGKAAEGITYTGTNGTSCFRSEGWTRSRVEGVGVAPAAGKTGAFAWDVDVSAAAPNSVQVRFKGCPVDLGSAGNDCGGWRYGHLGGGVGSMDRITQELCTVDGNPSGAVTGQIGWVTEHPNGLDHAWEDCAGSYCDKMFTNVSTPGHAAATGSNGVFFNRPSGSHNEIDFELATAGPYPIRDGRFEVGKKFISIPNGSSTVVVTVDTLLLATYQASEVFYINNRPANLRIVGLTANGTSYAADFIHAWCDTVGVTGVVTVSESAIRGADPFYTFDSGTWKKRIKNVQKLNSSDEPTAMMTNLDV